MLQYLVYTRVNTHSVVADYVADLNPLKARTLEVLFYHVPRFRKQH